MSHFYNYQGQLIDTIVGKNGKPRKTNIKDARELDLLPSVTELLKIFDKPALTKWKVTEALKYSADNPKTDQETIETYLSRVIPACYEKSSIAKDFGSLIHYQIECYLKNTPCPIPPEIEKFWPAVLKYIHEHKLSGIAEKPIVNVTIGYAGTPDLIGTFDGLNAIMDFKTQGTLDKDKKSKKINFYQEWSFQLAGYQIAYPETKAVSIVISSDEPERIEHKIWTDEEMKTARGVFKRLCEIYSLVKNLEFHWWSEL